MTRREFITLLGGAAASWPLAARAQQKVRRVGVLTGFPESDAEGLSLLAAFRQRLKALGWIEGQNVQIEVRWGEGADPARMHDYAVELVRMMPDVIVVHGARALNAVHRESDHIPIVFATIADPIGLGSVDSLARPSGNITGFTTFSGSPALKLVEALKEMAPSTTRIALVITPDNVSLETHWRSVESAATASGVTPFAIKSRDLADMERQIAGFAREPHGGLLIASDVFIVAHRDLIIGSAAKYRLPAIYNESSFVAAGGLMSYGADRKDNYRRVAVYVDRILRGAKPADLPVQQPVKFEFAINIKAAEALGLAVPTSILLRADEVIE